MGEHTGRRRVFAALLLVLLTVGCGTIDEESSSQTPLTSGELLAPGAAGVGVATLVFEDTTRPTMANRNFPGASTRTLLTEIWYPVDPGAEPSTEEQRDAPIASGRDRYPLVIYSHGFLDTRTGGTYLTQHLASYGYVVASMDYPLSNMSAPGGPTVADLPNQPVDIRFLIDQILALDGSAGSFLSGRIDRGRIGLAGLSLGGITTFLAAFHPSLGDARVRAAAPIAGGGCFFGPAFFRTREVPLLLVHGDLDAIVPYRENAEHAFEVAGSPKYLATIRDGTHTGFTTAGPLLFENLTNADDVGCASLGQTGPRDPELLERLGGAPAGLIMGDCPNACTDSTPRPRSIRPSRQQQLAIVSILPFFEATLRDSARHREYLEDTLAAENPELVLSFSR
jgi:predicted dienelactone hydrolase